MAQAPSLYKCKECGALLEVVVPCRCEDCAITCCGDSLELLEAGTTDAAVEKHVPVIEKIDWGWKVKVGSVAHPMQEDHWIEFIELIADNRVYRATLKPGDAPEAKFHIKAEKVSAREHCNLHGLWEASNE